MRPRSFAAYTALIAGAASCSLVFGDYEVDTDFAAAASSSSGAGAGATTGDTTTEGAGAGVSSTGEGGDTGVGGQGGGAPVDCDAPASEKPTVAVEGEITSSDTWTCERNYRLVGNVYITDGAELTIDPGTTVFGDLVTVGALVVQQGGTLIADGTADRPIVFTSSR